MLKIHKIWSLIAAAAIFLPQFTWAAALGPRLPGSVSLPFAQPISGFGFEDAFPLRFDQPIAILSVPGERNRLFVVERKGIIAVIPDLSSPTREVFLDIHEDTTSWYEEMGLLGVAFHPNFAQNGFFYVYRTCMEEFRMVNRLSRFQVSLENPNAANRESELVLISQEDLSQFHNGGDLHFGPDGYLYLSVGEASPPEAYRSDISIAIDQAMFGAVIRIDVDQRPGSLPPNPGLGIVGNYAVPADNPWVGATSFMGRAVNPERVRTELFAVGLRQPYRFSIDATTGEIYLGDVGAYFWEEINLISGGANYGYPYFEGPRQAMEPPAEFQSTPPLFHYGHGSAGNDVGSAVIGGLVVRGGNIPELEGAYIFGDFISGNVWKLTRSPEVSVEWIGREMALSAFGRDPRSGAVLVANAGSGAIRRLRLVPSAQSQVPETLSATGLFRNLETLEPADGLIPFEINTPFWSDYALKKRWFGLLEGEQKFGFAPEANWVLPSGSVWVKHFDLEMVRGDPTTARRLETRLLLKDQRQVFGYVYRWGGSTGEAHLVADAGMDEEFEIRVGGIMRTQVWHYPGRGECASCHTAAGGYALGFNTGQLNREVTHQGERVNQLEWMARLGYLEGEAIEPQNLRRLARREDETFPIEYRARSFLMANCVPCHQPEGLAFRMRWDARIQTPIEGANLVDSLPLINWLDYLTERIIHPGHADYSLLYSRLVGFDSFLLHMPPLASNERNEAALAMLAEWIDGIPVGVTRRQVGSTGLEGSLHRRTDSMVIGASGGGMTPSAASSFYFVPRAMQGNFQLVTKVRAVPGPSDSMQAGLAVMAHDAPEPMAWFVRKADGRNEFGRKSSADPLGAGASPAAWLRLLRQEGNLSAWESVDGREWSIVAETELSAPNELEGGLAVASGSNWRFATVEFADLEAVSVGLLISGANPEQALPKEILLEAIVSTNNASIRRVEFYSDDTLLGASDQSPWEFRWVDAWAGEHSLTAVATDHNGLSVASAPVGLRLRGAPPMVRFVRAEPVEVGWADTFGSVGRSIPLANSYLPGRATLEVDGLAIEYEEPSALSGVNASAWTAPGELGIRYQPANELPHRFTLFFAGYGANSPTVTLSFHDPSSGVVVAEREVNGFGDGAFVTFAIRGAVEIRVLAGSTLPVALSGIFLDPLPPPVVELLPVSTPVRLPASIPLGASAFAEGRDIVRVEFWDGAVKLGEDTEAPFEFLWETPMVGEHSLTAWAVGEFGSGTRSAAISVVCEFPPASAAFVGEDRVTQGDWIGIYGNLGHMLVYGWTNLPPTLGASVQANIWPFTLSDPSRAALRRTDSDTNRFAGCYFVQPHEPLELRIATLDGSPARLSLYLLDWLGAGRREEVSIYDLISETPLDRREIASFAEGAYLSWEIQGDLRVVIRSLNDYNTVVSAIFFDSTDSPSRQWLRERLPGLPATGAIWHEDPDADGRANLLEYAAGSDPLNRDEPIIRDFAVVGEWLQMTLRVGTTPADARITLESSVDLSEWLEASASRTEVEGGVVFRHAATEAGPRFFRLRAELLSE